ncbi:hypothetical protein GCM10022394_14040 [Zobellella aerophila]|uniref:Uncharacterized protein n=2 Tax=Zobellella aerophila TaxID=870480 RepID=A0ABP6VGT6_9GAMM
MVLFVFSGVVFVSGAIGFEMLAGRYVELHGKGNLIYSFFYTCEEFLEMLGIVIFIYAVLMYMVGEFKSFSITLHESKVKSVERVMCTKQKNYVDR